MFSTYLLDKSNSNYPFASKQNIPFSKACIKSINICMLCNSVSDLESYLLPVYVSSLDITDTYISVSVCIDRTESGVIKSRLLGVLKLYYNDIGATTISNSIKDSTLSDIKIIGSIQSGNITSADIGTYTGRFELDQTCFSIISNTLVSGYKYIQANSIKTETEQCISIKCSGLLQLTETTPETGSTDSTYTLSGTADTLNAELFSRPTKYGCSYITNINGYSCVAKAVDTYYTLILEIGSASTDSISLHPGTVLKTTATPSESPVDTDYVDKTINITNANTLETMETSGKVVHNKLLAISNYSAASYTPSTDITVSCGTSTHTESIIGNVFDIDINGDSSFPNCY